MTANRSETSAEPPLAPLERALIEAFIRSRGYDPDKLDELPEDQRTALLRDASIHASARLSEVESRSHFVHEIHDTPKAGRE
jgi:hypothetical protein